MLQKRVFTVFAAVMLLAALPAPADDGATPIPFTDPYATPQILRTPGHYVVTRNLQPTGPGPILLIECFGVAGLPAPAFTIDLNGMVLDNTGGPDAVILVIGDFRCEVIIRNGELIGGTQGVRYDPPGRKLVVEDVEIKEPSDEGIIAIDVENFAIRRNAIIETGNSYGIVMAGGAQKDGVIEDNIVRNTQGGIYVDFAQSVEISNNRLHQIGPGPFGGNGIYLGNVGSCLVTQNNISDVSGPVGDGIFLRETYGCKLHNNTVHRTQGRGIYLDFISSDNLVLDNVVRDASSNGIHIESPRNQVQRNVSNWCGGVGLYFVGAAPMQNGVGRNYMAGNGWAGPPPCFPLFPDFCDDTGTFVSQGDNVALGGPF